MTRKKNPMCRFCGQPLTQVFHTTPERRDWTLQREVKERLGEKGFDQWLKAQKVPTGTYGYHGNGWFCTLSCAYQWAVRQFGGRRVPEPVDSSDGTR